MAVTSCHIWSLFLLFFLADSPSGIFAAEESHKVLEQFKTTAVENVTVPSIGTSGHGYIANPIETSVTQGTEYEENTSRNFINTILQTLRNQSWKTNLRKMTAEILQRFVIPVFNSSNIVWLYKETVKVIKTVKLYVSEEKLGWMYNASLNAVDAVMPPFDMARWREAYTETMNAVDTYFLTPKRVLYTALAVSVAMNPTILSWFQSIMGNLVGLVDNTVFVATGRGLSRSFWSAYPDLRHPERSSYQRSANHTVRDTVADVIYEVAAAAIERIGELYLW